MPFFYNTDAVVDNEFGALDNQTLLAEIKRRADEEKAKADAKAAEDAYYTRDPVTGLSPAQVEARKAQEEAAAAKQAAEEAYKAALAEQERLRKEEEDRKKNAKKCPPAGTVLSGPSRVGNNIVTVYADGVCGTYQDVKPIDDGYSTSLVDSPTSVPSLPPPPPVPPKPVVIPPPPPPPPKTAPIDTILFDDEAVPIEIMSDMIFEDIGGHELINIARNDTINGQIVTYQPIKNLTSIQQQYNPNNIVSLQDTSDKYFANFSIQLQTSLLEIGDGSGPDGAYIFIESDTGDLIIELINIDLDQQMEVEVSQSGTIYEAELEES